MSYNFSPGKNEYFAILAGFITILVPISDDKVTIPSDVVGTVYVVVTTSNGQVSDDNTVAGPVIMIFPGNIVHKSDR
ncbi:hypothetical protein FRC00_003948, partial [Tulasnella sp. 408]